MHLIYIDDSSESGTYTFSALAVPVAKWADVFSMIKSWRRKIRDSDGIYIHKELHATEFVGGRGKISSAPVFKGRRCQIYRDCLSTIAGCEHLSLFNVCLQSRQDWAFERLLNRINRTMQAWDSYALLICDEGKEQDYTKLVRKMSVHNPIPSQFGIWADTASTTKNIPLSRIVEDPWFKDSSSSYFIQIADFCAYALLRKEVPLPADSKKLKYGLHTAFPLVEEICFKGASPKDDYGVIR